MIEVCMPAASAERKAFWDRTLELRPPQMPPPIKHMKKQIYQKPGEVRSNSTRRDHLCNLSVIDNQNAMQDLVCQEESEQDISRAQSRM